MPPKKKGKKKGKKKKGGTDDLFGFEGTVHNAIYEEAAMFSLELDVEGLFKENDGKRAIYGNFN